MIYDNQGKIYPYIDLVLNEIKKIVDDIYIVCNFSHISIGEEILRKYTNKIYFRQNVGYDAAAYKKVLLDIITWKNVLDYDEVILSNDTYYGPIYPFVKMHKDMSTLKCDYWGITSHPKGYLEKKEIPKHIQSYFFVLRKTVLRDERFLDFWKKSFEEYSFVDETIINFEIGINEFLKNLGYIGASYDEFLKINYDDNVNPYLFHSYDLIIKGIPIIKRKCFDINSEIFLDSINALKYIRDYTAYDEKRISEYLKHQTLKSNNSITFEKIDEFVLSHNKICVWGNGVRAKNLDVYMEYFGFPKAVHVVSDSHKNNNALGFSELLVELGMGMIITIYDPLQSENVYNIALSKFSKKDIIII